MTAEAQRGGDVGGIADRAAIQGQRAAADSDAVAIHVGRLHIVSECVVRNGCRWAAKVGCLARVVADSQCQLRRAGHRNEWRELDPYRDRPARVDKVEIVATGSRVGQKGHCGHIRRVGRCHRDRKCQRRDVAIPIRRRPSVRPRRPHRSRCRRAGDLPGRRAVRKPVGQRRRRQDVGHLSVAARRRGQGEIYRCPGDEVLCLQLAKGRLGVPHRVVRVVGNRVPAQAHQCPPPRIGTPVRNKKAGVGSHRVRGDADAVAVEVRRLHGVPEGVLKSAGHQRRRPRRRARVGTDSECHRRGIVVYEHVLGEREANLNRLARVVGVVRPWAGRDSDAGDDRRRIHFVAGGGGDSVATKGEIGVAGVRRVAQLARASQGQRARADADAVVVIVGRLHLVAKAQGAGVGLADIRRVARVRANREGQTGVGCRNRYLLVKLHIDADGLQRAIAVAASRAGTDGNRAHHRDGGHHQRKGQRGRVPIAVGHRVRVRCGCASRGGRAVDAALGRVKGEASRQSRRQGVAKDAVASTCGQIVCYRRAGRVVLGGYRGTANERGRRVVHRVPSGVGNGVGTEVERGGFPVGTTDATAVQGQRGGANADAVAVEVRRLHGVLETNAVITVERSYSRLARVVADSQCQLRIAGHRDGPVK